MTKSEVFVGARVKVVKAPRGEENSWLQDRMGTIIDTGPVYLKVQIDGPMETVLLDLSEIDRLPTPVEPKAQVESEKCEVCGQPKNNGWIHGRSRGDLATLSCLTTKGSVVVISTEPKEVESGGLELPVIPMNDPSIANEWSDYLWPSDPTCTQYNLIARERQLKASLLREERQQELLRECYRILTTDSTGKEHDEVIQKLFKAAVTGE